MENQKIGLIENSAGEKSHTKLIHLVVALCIMVGWAIVSIQDNALVAIDPTLLALLAICMGGNGINKWIESNGISEKVKLIKRTVGRVKK